MVAKIMIKRLFQKPKLIIRCVVIGFQILSLWISKNKSSEYCFSLKDAWLFFKEKTIKLPAILEKELDAEFRLITIGSEEIYWPLSLRTTDLPWLHHEIFDDFACNPSSYNHPRMKFESKEWILDAGCSEGYFSLFANKIAPARTKIVALEPLPEVQESLMRTFKLFPSREFILLNTAVGQNDDFVSFESDPDHLCDAKVLDCQPIDFELENNTIRVKLAKIDTIVTDLKLSGEGLIKMDVEGYEMKALLGARETLKRLKPSLAIAVYHEYENAVQCAQIIKEANSDYKIELRGMYGYFIPPRPYMLFAY